MPIFPLTLASCVATLSVVTVASPAAPVLVTATVGEVQLLAADGSPQPTPAIPFLFTSQTVLQLANQSQVVLLDGAQIVVENGPRTLRAKTPPATGGASIEPALEDILGRAPASRRVGAARSSDGLVLMRPVPDIPLLALQTIRWRCDDCGAQQVDLIRVDTFTTLWTSTATGAVRYDGPTLTPGDYMVLVDGTYHAFSVAPDTTRSLLTTALQSIKASSDDSDNALGTVAATAAVYAQSGLSTEALYALDGALKASPKSAPIQALRLQYERQLGLIE